VKSSFFFSPEELAKQKKPAPKSRGRQGCSACGLDKDCLSPRMEPYGEGKLRIAIVGEAPGEEEDKQGIPLRGSTGKLLKGEFVKEGVKLDEDCIILNVAQCRPPDNRTPTVSELQACWPRVEKQLKEFRPELIFAFGTPAISQILRDSPFSPNATNMHGRVVPNAYWNSYVACSYHPSFFQHREGRDQHMLREAIRAGLDKWEAGAYEEEDYILDPDKYWLVEDVNDVENLLRETNRLCAFDYETTGTSPYELKADKESRRGFQTTQKPEILTAAFATGLNESFCIPLEHPQSRWTDDERERVRQAVIRWLLSDCPKIIQNWQFEELWSWVKYGVRIKNVVCDTMVREHIIDNRTGVCGQGFQSYVRYGVVYKDMVDITMLAQTPLDLVAKYNSLDVRYLYQWKHGQDKQMTEGLTKAYSFFHKAIPVMATLKSRGILVDTEKMDVLDDTVQEEIDQLESSLEGEKVDGFKKKFRKDFDPDSNQSKARMFYDHLGLKPLRLAGKSGYSSVDAESLEFLKKQVRKDSEAEMLVRLCMEKGHLTKLSGTYIKGIKNLLDIENYLRPSFLLHIPQTYRSSSANPNFHNFPIHNPILSRMRRVLVPRNDLLMEADYSGAEVPRTAAIRFSLSGSSTTWIFIDTGRLSCGRSLKVK